MLLDVGELKNDVLVDGGAALISLRGVGFLRRHEVGTSSSGRAASFDGPGNQHAARRFGPTGASGGCSAHLACRREHLGANLHPLGGFSRSGGRPAMGTSRSLTWSP